MKSYWFRIFIVTLGIANISVSCGERHRADPPPPAALVTDALPGKDVSNDPALQAVASDHWFSLITRCGQGYFRRRIDSTAANTIIEYKEPSIQITSLDDPTHTATASGVKWNGKTTFVVSANRSFYTAGNQDQWTIWEDGEGGQTLELIHGMTLINDTWRFYPIGSGFNSQFQDVGCLMLPPFPRQFERSDNSFAKFNVATVIRIDKNGHVEAQTTTVAKGTSLILGCSNVSVWLFDNNDETLERHKSKVFCAVNHQDPIDGAHSNSSTDSWTFTISTKKLYKIGGISILHGPGNSYYFKNTLENKNKAVSIVQRCEGCST